jgi:predicted heme/steroid binding protein
MKKSLLMIVSVTVALALIGTAVALRGRSSEQSGDSAGTQSPDFSPNANGVLPPPVSAATEYDAASLAKFDGQNGSKCYVAVDGTVYEIDQGLLWKDGQHSTSNGQASCGRDLSEVIKQSPHGKSKLEQLTKVGTFRAVDPADANNSPAAPPPVSEVPAPPPPPAQ